MNAKLQSFINFFLRNNKLQMYLFFFMISMLLWFLSNMSQQYKYVLKVPLRYSNVSNDVLIENLPNDTLSVTVLASGYQLLKFHLWQPVVAVDVQQNHIVKNKPWRTSLLLQDLKELIGVENTIVNVDPKEIIYKLNDIRKKKVKIIHKITINYKKGYKNVSNIKIYPDSIWVFALPGRLSELEVVETKPLLKNNVFSSLDADLPLDLPEGVKSNVKRVRYTVDVDRFIELVKSLDFDLINVPEDVDLLLFPRKALLKFNVFKSDYLKVMNNDIKVQLDFNERDTVLYPRIINLPQNTFNVHVQPQKVAFLIKK